MSNRHSNSHPSDVIFYTVVGVCMFPVIVAVILTLLGF